MRASVNAAKSWGCNGRAANEFIMRRMECVRLGCARVPTKQCQSIANLRKEKKIKDIVHLLVGIGI